MSPRAALPAGLRILQQTTVYKGQVIELVREVLDARGRRVVRETVRHPGSVVVVPVLDADHVLLIRQYRRAVERYLLELPAGTLAPGEDPRRCAPRELREETGWSARRWHRLGTFFPAPGFLDERMTIYLATDLRPGVAAPEPDEVIEPVRLSWRAAEAKIRSGAICDAKTIIGLLLARRRLQGKA
jgi:ADP-ribose pyrophosphatase